MRVCAFTSCAFPKRLEAFLFEDLLKAVDDSVVCGLARSGCYLEPGLDDISRGHQRGRRYALGDVQVRTKPRPFTLPCRWLQCDVMETPHTEEGKL